MSARQHRYRGKQPCLPPGSNTLNFPADLRPPFLLKEPTTNGFFAMRTSFGFGPRQGPSRATRTTILRRV
jgi:hypothetical protein